MKRIFLMVLLFLLHIESKAQQFALFNTKTLYDAFENPAQKAFVLDSSRQFASNFLIPYLDISSLSKGNSEQVITDLINQGYSHSRFGNFTNPKTVREDINIYLLAIRLFSYHRYHSELGFSWQIRVNSTIDYDKNLSKGLFYDNVANFATIPRANIFNNNGKVQAYHQLSISYRENYDNNWSFGIKASLLSGLGYSDFYADTVVSKVDLASNEMRVKMNGNYRLNFPSNTALSFKSSLPFKNLGAAISLGLSYQSNSGILMMANIKDLGFISWNKNSFVSTFNDNLIFKPITGTDAVRKYKSAMENIGRNARVQKKFVSNINSRFDFLLSKTFGSYTPNLIITKNIFDKYGEFALVNTLKSGLFYFSLVPGFDNYGSFKLGAQGMIKSPNFEMFLGTNDLINSYYTSKEIIKNNQAIPTGYNRGSVYLGMAFKIGYVVEHPMNSSYMPGGIGAERVGDDTKPGFFKRIFKKKN